GESGFFRCPASALRPADRGKVWQGLSPQVVKETTMVIYPTRAERRKRNPPPSPDVGTRRAHGAPHPRRGNVDARVTTAQFAIYDGRDRLGSFRRRGDNTFEAYDRLGRCLGTFETQDEVLAAIEGGAGVMTARERLANRRASSTFELEFGGLRYSTTISRFSDGRVGEIFLQNHKPGSQSDANARDAAVAASLALQFGCPLEVLRRALLRDAQGRASTPLGAVVDCVANEPPP